MSRVRYVDHATTEALRAKYKTDPNINVDNIVEVDYVWGAQSLPELVKDEAPFDYAIASHVIEHVPDLVGWLKEIHAILKPGGILSLAIPDKRFCFDYYRSLTRPADILDAYLRGARKPSPRQIFDFFSSVVSRQGEIAWEGQAHEHELVHIHTESQAWEVALRAATSDIYEDVHCWVFTPDSFLQLLKTLINLKLFDFKVARFYETTRCEFYVSLEALEEGSEPVQLQLESLPQLLEQV
ncbi:methyltransferase domain-containing protein [Phormidium tenue FACHB-886]|nr:methyltransferase domain-containing protein [Phormidium tenue FACHB-886]